MSYKTLSDYDDAQLDELAPVRDALARDAKRHGIRSVRMTVDDRHDVPALRVESRHAAFSKSPRDVLADAGMVMLTAFATADDGHLVGLFGYPEGEGE